MQPEFVTKLPTGSNWQYELKWDGYRAIAVKAKDKVTIYSRNRIDLTPRYPSVSEQLRQLKCDEAVIDGELIALDEKGRPSFQLLQNYSRKGKQQLLFVAFDLLNVNGHSLTSVPLTERRIFLLELAEGTSLQVSEPLNADLDTVLQVVRDQGLEGVVAKERSSVYEPGSRGGSWFKHRIGLTQEFLIGGYTKSGDSFTSLLVGYYSGHKLLYAGKVKAGFVPATRRNIMKQLEPRNVTNCPFAELPVSKSSRWGEGLTAEDIAKCVWVKPNLVALVNFVEWTKNSSLRHAKFIGMKDNPKASKLRKRSG
jgi:DNA ligase D-like protein (predicted ligase)